ncbi:hypothetical protein CSUB01_03045 [Colletotrichum sublineola]|uniref:Uncharacterized protein n=1 Tax=Colletotrichum sublineola TaxID=1173701 RepID=A0A066XKA2_COLSU|nr:hypothetical protein CSUB01_03045 [Colletotrichum sublineola]
MAIRDHFRRRKSVCEPSQSDQHSSEPPKSPALRLAKTFGWRSTKDEKTKKKPMKEKSNSRERPFNETNLRHQEILNGFTMTFGKNQQQMSRDQRSSYYSVNCTAMMAKKQEEAEIHWCGPESDKASKELTIKLSKGTTAILNAREEKFQIEFPFTIRGVKVVDIQHVRSAAKFQLNDFERQSLHSALELNVLMPRQCVYAGWRSF